MKKFFRLLPLPVKLLLIGVPPLIFSLFLTTKLISTKTENIKLLSSYHKHINESENIIHLVDQLQQELKYSYMQAVRHQIANELQHQRNLTDASINQLSEVDDSLLDSFTSFTFLNELPSIRSRADLGQIRPDELTSYYINAIYRISSLSSTAAINYNYLQSINREVNSQKLLSQMINFLSIIRSNIYNVLYSHQNGVGTIYGLRGVYDIYHSYEKEFLLNGPPSAINDYKKLAHFSTYQVPMTYLDSIFKRNQFDSTFNADSWWLASGSAIDHLKNLQNQIKSHVESQLGFFNAKELASKNRMLLLMILAFVLLFTIVIYTIYSINNLMSEMKQAAYKLSKGLTGIRFDPFPNDVIGSLSECIIKIDEANRELADAAEAIGHGEFDIPVHPRSKDDVLGNAILHMKEELQKFTELQKFRQQQISKAILTAQEKERNTIGEEMHDNINQLLTSIKLYIEIMINDKSKENELLPKTRQIIISAIEEIRKLSRKLVLPSSEIIDLNQAIEDLADDILVPSHIRYNLDLKELESLDISEESKIVLYRIIQEQLTNIIKYAEATIVTIAIKKKNDEFFLLVSDNGKGFDILSRRKGVGLSNISSRAKVLNGRMEIESSIGKGCLLKVIFNRKEIDKKESLAEVLE